MRNIILAALALTGLAAMEARAAAPDTSRVGSRSAPAELVQAPVAGPLQPDDYQDGYDRAPRAAYAPQVRVWLDNDRDILRVGERSRVLVRTDEDAYVAVLHIDTNGDVEFLFPRSPQDEGYVRGGRTYSLPAYGNGYLSVRGGYGIGYVFAVASSEPLDTYAFRDAWYRSARWDAERNVYGDPFFAMERFEERLVGDVDYGAHTTDYYSYHVGRRYSYPRYACYDSYGSWYYNHGAYWDSCDRIRVLLVTRPYYYDTRYWRGDRRVYYRRWYGDYYAGRRDRNSDHGYKGRGDAVTTTPPLRRQGSGAARDAGGAIQRAGDREQVQQPERTRPTFGRRSAEPPAEQPRNAEPRYVPQRGERETERRAEPPAERRTEPQERRSSPPAERRSEPRGERSSSPPPRVERSEPRRESSPPPRSSSSGSGSRSSGSSGGGGSRRPN